MQGTWKMRGARTPAAPVCPPWQRDGAGSGLGAMTGDMTGDLSHDLW